MMRQSSSAGPCKFLDYMTKKLCGIFAKERKKKNMFPHIFQRRI